MRKIENSIIIDLIAVYLGKWLNFKALCYTQFTTTLILLPRHVEKGRTFL